VWWSGNEATVAKRFKGTGTEMRATIREISNPERNRDRARIAPAPDTRTSAIPPLSVDRAG